MNVLLGGFFQYRISPVLSNDKHESVAFETRDVLTVTVFRHRLPTFPQMHHDILHPSTTSTELGYTCETSGSDIRALLQAIGTTQLNLDSSIGCTLHLFVDLPEVSRHASNYI
jgi:hypothetical protein